MNGKGPRGALGLPCRLLTLDIHQMGIALLFVFLLTEGRAGQLFPGKLLCAWIRLPSPPRFPGAGDAGG